MCGEYNLFSQTHHFVLINDCEICPYSLKTKANCKSCIYLLLKAGVTNSINPDRFYVCIFLIILQYNVTV